jgi:hypothetical protein
MIKELVLASTVVLVVGCAGGPSKLERIEANESKISNLQSQTLEHQLADDAEHKELAEGIVDTNIKIDRMFEKAQYK